MTPTGLFNWWPLAIRPRDVHGRSRNLRLGLLSLSAALGAYACDPLQVAPPGPATVTVTPATSELESLGWTVQLAAEVRNQEGELIPGAIVTWSSDRPDVATVSGSGVVTAVANGSATVTATSGPASGSATVNVEQRLVEVHVLPKSVTLLAIGDAARLAAEGRDGTGHVVANIVVEWSSDDTAVRVDAGGVVTAVREGEAVVTARSGGASDSAVVTVKNTAGHARERAILELFYEATGGPSWTNTDNWLTDAPLDDWYGVRTDMEGRVVELSLVANNLEGHIPPALGGLGELRHLELDGTQAIGLGCAATGAQSGAGRGWLGSLSEGNNYDPHSWVTHTVSDPMHAVGIDSPDEFPAHPLPSAGTRLQRPGNRLAGRIPPELGNLANLEWLTLGVNALSGPLPPELGKLVNLRILWLTGNLLTGSLPPELGNLTSLERLDLAIGYDFSLDPPRPRSFLSGTLPRELGKLVNLKRLNLFGHKITGEVPPEFGRLVQLQYLGLQCNRITGPLSSELRYLRDLRFLSLFGNRLQGDFPAWLGELTRLETVDFTNNALTGAIPPGVGALTRLGKLYLPGNSLSGPIPTEIGRMTNLGALVLGGNQLTGSIPAEIGHLTNLARFDVALTQLTGPIPAEIGLLPNLAVLSVGWSPLAGTLPRSLMQAPLLQFSWAGTGLCSPRDRVFQGWLAGIRYLDGGRRCTLIPREFFAAFYEATGGSGWNSNANWLTDAPVSSWFGVTVEDSLITALELPTNGLAGTLPSVVGDFVDLKRLDLARNELTGDVPADLADLGMLEALDLSRNRFSGRVAPELGRLGALESLDLSENELDGALPGAFTGLESLSDFNWTGSGACAPEVAWFQTWLASVANSSGPTCDGLFSLSVADAHLSQATQSLDGAVPLIAGRPALARVFATADRANDFRPSARATLLLNGREIYAVDIGFNSTRGLAERSSGQLEQWHHTVIPAAALRPGVEMTVRLDPDSIIPRNALDDVRLRLDVREMPPLELTIVPIVTGSSRDNDVLNWIQGADDPPIEFMRAVLPVGELDLSIREPLTIASPPDALSLDNWNNVLRDVELLRTTEGGSGYWYGVVSRAGDRGIAGIAYVDGRASIGIADARVFAHEVGHNMSLRHSPCGRPQQVDPDYPYPDGNIGVHGYDPRADTLVDPSTPDLMSYCLPQWISDYSFNKALHYRMEAETDAHADAPQGRVLDDRLLLWGGVNAEGRLRLDPAFVLKAPAKVPLDSGPYRVEGFHRDGAIVFSLDFDMVEVSEGGGAFLFLIPFEEDRVASLERIVLSGPEGGTTLDRQTVMLPMAIVTDPATGRIQSILRDQAVVAAVAASRDTTPPGMDRRVQVLVSYGVPGQVNTLR